MPGSNGMECKSLSFQFGGTYFGSCPGTHYGTYVVSHVVGHDALWLLQANGVPPLPEGPFLHTKRLGEIVPAFCMFSISCHT